MSAAAAARLALAVAALAAPLPAVAQPAVLGASSGTDTVLVGEPFLVGVLLDAPDAAQAELVLDVPVGSPYAITVPSRRAAGEIPGRWRIVATMVVWVVDPPPSTPARVRISAADGTVTTVAVELPLPPLRATLPDDALLPRGPRGIVPASTSAPKAWWPAFAALLAALLLAAAAWRLPRRRGGGDTVDRRRDALAALARLRDERFPERGRVDEHYGRLSRIVRDFAVPDLGGRLTTAEAVERLRSAGAHPASVDRLTALLTDADLARFARSVPTAERAQADLERAHGWIRDFDDAALGEAA